MGLLYEICLFPELGTQESVRREKRRDKGAKGRHFVCPPETRTINELPVIRATHPQPLNSLSLETPSLAVNLVNANRRSDKDRGKFLVVPGRCQRG